MNGKRTLSPRRPLWLAGALMLVLGSGGCGSTATTADLADGRKALQTALDAWKGGQTPDALAKSTPSIHVADGDWKSGLLLQSYKADDEGKLVGTDLNYAVVLELKNDKGKVTSKKAVYAVSTHPQLLVLRQDD
ncbi:MAG: hypothetical protein P4L85_14740 [Paludisphaera borealis]|uniref:hypothetical protein n=1 Tax=Paludisphaera borealis TaxID=1387353 RepID=UPI00283D06A7|nr:hypothetical protein [Paludisphaera borealis]MDR3620606.1 hypothetical protein [Paludisphaera borealis]